MDSAIITESGTITEAVYDMAFKGRAGRRNHPLATEHMVQALSGLIIEEDGSQVIVDAMSADDRHIAAELLKWAAAQVTDPEAECPALDTAEVIERPHGLALAW